MPPRNSTADEILQAVSRHIRLLCEREWGTVRLGDVADVASGGTPGTGNPAYWHGETVWVTPKDLGRPRDAEIRSSERMITELALAHSSARLLPAGTVILSSRAPIGHLALAAVPLATNQGCKNIICRDGLQNRFLFHVLRGSIQELQSHGRGNTFAEIPGKVVKAFSVPAPPLDVQKAVAVFLDALYLRFGGQQADLPQLPPPMSEVPRIVRKIERIATNVDAARTLRDAALEEAETLCRSIVINDPRSVPTPLKELLLLRRPDVEVETHESYEFAGVYCFGRGVFRGDIKTGLEFAYPRLTRLHSGDFVYPKLMAWEGAFGVVPDDCDGCLVSPEFPVFEIDEDRVFHEVLDVYFRMPSVWPVVTGLSTGTNVRRRRLKPQDFLAYSLPLPSRRTQETLRRVRLRVDSLKRLHRRTSPELDALIPSVLDGVMLRA